MCLILTALAAVVSTAVWYASKTMRDMKVSVLCWLFWGAAIMWLVDLVFEYAEEGAAVFEPSVAEVLNDSLLGLAVITLALVIWTVVYLVSDPKGVLRSVLLKKAAQLNALGRKDLGIDGKDLMGLGFEGREIGVCLEHILSAVNEKALPNEHDALMRYAQEMYEGL